MKKKYYPGLTTPEKLIVIEMFNEGHGPQHISCKLRLPSGHVTRFLASVGLKRTKAQSVEVKPFYYTGSRNE